MVRPAFLCPCKKPLEPVVATGAMLPYLGPVDEANPEYGYRSASATIGTLTSGNWRFAREAIPATRSCRGGRLVWCACGVVLLHSAAGSVQPGRGRSMDRQPHRPCRVSADFRGSHPWLSWDRVLDGLPQAESRFARGFSLPPHRSRPEVKNRSLDFYGLDLGGRGVSVCRPFDSGYLIL